MQTFTFTDAQFMSAKEKESVLRSWKRFVKALGNCKFDKFSGGDYSEFPEDLRQPFSIRLYKHLSLHCGGFIAHYNIYGFLGARFGTPSLAQETLKQMRDYPTLPDYADIHKAMLAELDGLPNRLRA
jgi:hypothetical protein